MKVCEIFTSIQGESSHAGRLCTFVRFSGCNLRCKECDTAYAFDGGVEYGKEEILKEIYLRALKLVELTGGEPLLQPGIHDLINNICDKGYDLLIETNGSLSIEGMDPRAIIIMDVKTPLSGMSESLHMDNLRFLKSNDEVKFVIYDRADYEWSKEFVFAHGLMDKCNVLFSPCYGIIEPSRLARWMIEDRIDARLNLQAHKYIFGENERGV